LSDTRGAGGDAIVVVGVVVVGVAVVVDIVEVSGRAARGRTQPPVRSNEFYSA